MTGSTELSNAADFMSVSLEWMWMNENMRQTVNQNKHVSLQKFYLQCCVKKLFLGKLISAEWFYVSVISLQDEYDFGKNRGNRGRGNLLLFCLLSSLDVLTYIIGAKKKRFLQVSYKIMFDFRWLERKKTKPPPAIWVY